ncbi:DNA primase [Lysinibacillus sphaericus]|uniref:Phage-like protein n=2 Tax=Lysinibacillus sphaericus TaxID=1421 RepID=A0AAJ5A6J9_LYSSH|nr:phage/plasmid primase, P4 family [Lysinibacillus sphaericus]TKI18538.1 DNA primase [Lysinibacillus sphaericus]GEC84545.1 hypothetical protein LSP03_42880 [Lysinibacillus sphaericus]SUX55543.1 phage-like protein [Lysinibacillus sphaericus]
MTLYVGAKITAPNFDNMPQALRDIPQWCCWNSNEVLDKEKQVYKLSKEPANPVTKRRLAWKNKNNLVTFEEAKAAYESGGFNGVGFVLYEDTPFVCVDLDDIEDIDNVPAALHNYTIHSYTEKSPSGSGLHLWIEGKKPSWVGTKKNGVEFFGGQAKFITMTGDLYNNMPIVDNPQLIEMIAKDFFGDPPKQKKSPKLQNEGKSFGNLSDRDLLERMFSSKNGSSILALWNGDISKYAGDESKADQALANHLAYWTNGDFDRIHHLMQLSALNRMHDKWTKHPTYLATTIEKAIADTNTYNVIIPDNTNVSQQQPVEVTKRKAWWVENANGTKTLKHRILAEEIMQNYSIVRYPTPHSDLYYYNQNKGIYEQDKSGRQLNAIIRNVDDLTRNQVKEVREYINDMSPIVRNVSHDYVAVENGLINLQTFKLEEFTPTVFLIQKIPTNYNENAYDPYIDSTLHKVANGHEASIQNIKEMFACVLYPDVLVPKMFYLYGRSAHNGKSSVLNMIHETFDKNGGNISAVSPQKLASNTFAGASMYGKIANVVDDQPDQFIEDSGMLKTIITGGRIEIERKGKDSETVKMSTVLITASNYFPNFRENGKQINRRLHIIPFEHDFSSDPNCMSDVESMQRIASQSAREYVLKLAVDTLKLMLSNPNADKLTANDKSLEAGELFAEHNDPLADYFFEYDADYFNDFSGTRVLREYEEWCKDNRVHPLGAKRFKEAVCSRYDMEWKQKRISINSISKTVKGFKSKKVETK